ncbi:hypothetical protein BRADI_3g47015v3 [Brachypodium distachyon]|uniref:Uncharacterized protein n=1 Tax=Brachypodium distachyon TaxID=15368 RepID=A0A2K2D3T3_BRADI|nr:hypothetical protein BRADI_3g47015v3 [Brachypodium distachyon]
MCVLIDGQRAPETTLFHVAPYSHGCSRDTDGEDAAGDVRQKTKTSTGRLNGARAHVVATAGRPSSTCARDRVDAQRRRPTRKKARLWLPGGSRTKAAVDADVSSLDWPAWADVDIRFLLRGCKCAKRRAPPADGVPVGETRLAMHVVVGHGVSMLDVALVNRSKEANDQTRASRFQFAWQRIFATLVSFLR